MGTKEKRPKIGVLIASLGGGGAERMAMRLVTHLPERGYETFLLALDRNRDYTDDVAAAEQMPGHLSASDVRWPTVAKVAMAPWQWIRLNRRLKQLKPDLLISFMERANIINLAQRSTPRKIISIRTHYSRMMAAKSPLKRTLVARAYRRLLPAAEKIVFNSVESKCDFERIYALGVHRTRVAHNFCDQGQLKTAAAAPVPAGLPLPAQGPLVVTCGRLGRQKGHWHLLRAFRAVGRTHPQARLVVCGKGPLKADLMRLCQSLQIEDKVIWAGFVPNPLPLMARADLLVLPSLWEGFPNVLLEAMAIGTPVVAADCVSGPRELLVPDSDPALKTDRLEKTPYGFLVPPMDGRYRWQENCLSEAESALARAISLMLEDDVYRLACAAATLERARAFSPKKALRQWQATIEEVLNNDA
jgi:glycosyltransferase involved in cell wall biosynthesis